ncbi:SMC family ATPase [Actinotalea sp.]|uniref:SMC family ATPase n=1 Tax=Actinotalea sp. TaxID=1872145 RepID=UPI002C7670AE|nr:SMC family ATPase [Actinotalea sp.]HRA49537.1 SMC family ATPase [Actinotalea sp.]
MYLHRMTFQAVGPFAGEHTIDFAALGASGIFLLEGPTGAGKSTIIDAVVFALYGKVAAREASEDRLRSSRAAPNDETYVDLVLETGAGIYRVRRTPAYARPKQRGSGTTLQQATVRLWRLTSPDAPDDGELLTSRMDEAGLELQRAIGLDRSQFVQTVVLPQGEFASFLRADPEARRGLLQRVFGTEVYEQVQKRLEAMRAEVGRSVDDARAGVGRAAAGFIGAAGLVAVVAGEVVADGATSDDAMADGAAADGPAADGAGVAPAAPVTADGVRDAAAVPRTDDLLALVRAVTAELAGVAGTAEREAAAARAVAAERGAAWQDARTRADAVERRDALRAELADLDTRAAQHAQGVVHREAALRARVVLPLVLGAELAEQTAERAAGAVDRARSLAAPEVGELVDAGTPATAQLAALVAEQERCTATRATLVRLLALEQGLPARHREAAAAAHAVEQRSAEVERLTERQAERPAQRAALVEDRSTVAVLASGPAAAEQRVAAAAARLAAVVDVARLRVEVGAAEAATAVAATAAQESVAHAARVAAARIAGMAGELAAGLEPGLPCVVCGGVEHPAPAALDPAHVGTQDVEEAERRRAGTTAALTAVAAELRGLRERLDQRAAAAGEQDEAAARASLADAEADVVAARAAVTRLAELDQALVRFDAAAVEADQHLAALAANLAAQRAGSAAAAAQLDTDEAEVLAGRAGAASVRERAAALDEHARRVGDWAVALRTHADAGAQALLRRAEAERTLVEQGFDGATAARAAHLEPAALADLERALAAREATLARVRAGLDEPSVAAVGDLELADLDLPGVRAAHEVATEQASRAAAEAARTGQRAASATGALVEVERAVVGFVDAVGAAGPVIRMANLAAAGSSDNTRQLTLATYVLGRRFGDVVAAANVRLLTMSDGRYELVHSTEREDVRTRRTGLAMKVVDHLTETPRDPRTLSGGETFYVSLCLALGLADVVTAEAGGIDLGTLVVDEGFGSLDAETLEVVLAELGRLRDGGRVVAVVSHVDALKQAIAERIEVRRRGDGSSTLTVRA